ncbi:ABC transporter permease [Eubacteriales bacterium OttesenSCG-928-A19]|nr:ABC transporter permease [Eubacteriales bacterium OttesenSCG-928-A19]
MEEKKTRQPLYMVLIKYREIGLLIILALLILVVGLRNPLFVQPKNLLFIVEDTSIMAILAAGMLCVLLVGSIDISIAGIMALSAMVTGVIMRRFLTNVEVTAVVDGVQTLTTVRQSLPLAVLILIGIGTGAVLGLVNGVLIAYGGVLPIVTTLGMQYVIYGLAHIVSDATAVYRKDMSDAFFQFTRVTFLGANSKIWIMLFVYALLFLFITYFRSGRHLYAVGSNAEAAEMRGVPVKRTKVMAHVIMGALAGLAGLLYASHDTKITQDMATGYEMYVIAACVIGGVAVTGGVGKIQGVLLGALTIGVINNGLTMMRLTGNSEFWKKAIQGALILIAVVSNVVLQRVMDRQNLRRRNI